MNKAGKFISNLSGDAEYKSFLPSAPLNGFYKFLKGNLLVSQALLKGHTSVCFYVKALVIVAFEHHDPDEKDDKKHR